MSKDTLKSPVPYFGGKSKIASTVWERFGDVPNYVEPFFGSGAVLLGRPGKPGTETVNDADGLVSNFWRALSADPEAVAEFADWPVNECDLHARHAWLVGQKESLQSRLEGDPDFHNAKIAGWWVWGVAVWIGSGFCSGKGPWHVVDGLLTKSQSDDQGIIRQRVHVGNAGRGINRQLVHVGDAGRGINRKRVHVGNAGQGVNRKQLAHVGDAGRGGVEGVERKRPVIAGSAGGPAHLPQNEELIDYFHQLSSRLRHVRVCCGDWSRVCGPSVTVKNGITAVFLDPPYADTANRSERLYRIDCTQVAHAVRDWAVSEGQNPLMRIALCGYSGEHEMPADWDCVAWNAGAGLGVQSKDGISGNGKKERVWFSPHCLKPNQINLL